MRNLLKNIGLLFIIAGVAMLVIGYLTDHISNTLLGCAMGVIVIGLAGYIIINKML